MPHFIRVAGVLMGIGFFSAFFLSLMADYAYPLIEKNREARLRKSIYTVLPETKTYHLVNNENNIYKGLNKDSIGTGYAFVAEGGGYQGIIKIMIGIDILKKKISGLKILENVETPGLGSKISSDKFQNQFIGKLLNKPIEYILNKNPQAPFEIQAITGATISTRAVVNIVNKRIQEVKSIPE